MTKKDTAPFSANPYASVFGKSRRKLTVYFSAVVTISLIIVIGFANRFLELSMYSEQTNELINAAKSVAFSQGLVIQHRGLENDDILDIKSINEWLFFYAIDLDGRTFNQSSASREIEPFALEVIKNWNNPPDTVRLYSPEQSRRGKKFIMTAHPISVNNSPAGTVYVGKDVTAIFAGQKRVTDAMAIVAIAGLLVAAVTGYFTAGKAMRPLVEAYETQRQFAADASHELRTPLSVVMASCDLLLNDPTFTSPFLRQVIDDVRDEVKKMTRLVSGLLFIARSDNQGIIIEPRNFDLAETAKKVIRLMQPLAEEKEIRLEQTGAETTIVHADADKIRQIMMVLVDNAIKYTNPGGHVTLKIAEAVKGHFSFSVEDNGIGIAPDDLPHIFDRFYRADKARSRKIGGNGLGLSIAHELAKLNFGTIKVESELGKGSTFSVSLNEI